MYKFRTMHEYRPSDADENKTSEGGYIANAQKDFNMNTPFFSIIVPIFKARQDYLEKCITSILRQSFQNIELILVDDGSPDNCGIICDSYAQDDSRVRVIHQNNQGVSMARNNAIECAKANWIMFVDADDWLEEDACERLYAYLCDSNYDMLLFHAVREFAGNQIVMSYGLQDGWTYDTANIEEREFLYRRAMQTPNTIKPRVWPVYYSCDKVYNRDFLIRNNLHYPQGLVKSEDKVFILRCFEKLSKLHCVDDVLYHYRINADSVCNRYSENIDSARIMLIGLLEELAQRMDAEIGALKKDSTYDLLNKDFKRFVFGILSDVLLLKYYHPDYPDTREKQRKEAKAFLECEPFKSALLEADYKQLTMEAKFKKFFLSHGFLKSFCLFSNYYRTLRGKAPEV